MRENKAERMEMEEPDRQTVLDKDLFEQVNAEHLHLCWDRDGGNNKEVLWETSMKKREIRNPDLQKFSGAHSLNTGCRTTTKNISKAKSF